MLVYAEISIEVGNNCGAGTCTVHTQTDLEVLRSYVQNGATLQPSTDGVVNNADIDRLAELILEQTN